MAEGLAKALSATKRSTGGGGSSGQRSSPELDAGARASPGPSTSGPSRTEAATGDAVYKRPGPLSFKKKAKSTAIMDLTGESSSDDMSGNGDITPFSDMSSDTNRMVSQAGQPKRGRGRPPTTGEWVGVEAVRKELELLKQEHEKVVAERDVLAGRFEASFGATAGKIPSADDMMEELTDETVDSLLEIILGEMEVVEHVAERSGSLRIIGTFKGRLRAASRRAVAASKLLFTRATIRAVDDRGSGALEQARRELCAARDFIGEAKDKIRRLEEKVKVLKAKETLWAAKATRTSPPPCDIPAFEADIGGDVMEVEECSPGGRSRSRVDLPGGRTPVTGDPPTDPAPSFDLVERIVERVLGKLRLPRETSGRSSAPPSQPLPSGGRESWSRVVGRKAKKKAMIEPLSKEVVPPPSAPTPGSRKRRKKKKKKKKKEDPIKGATGFGLPTRQIWPLRRRRPPRGWSGSPRRRQYYCRSLQRPRPPSRRS